MEGERAGTREPGPSGGEGARPPVAETLATMGRGTTAETLATEGNGDAQGRRRTRGWRQIEGGTARRR